LHDNVGAIVFVHQVRSSLANGAQLPWQRFAAQERRLLAVSCSGRFGGNPLQAWLAPSTGMPEGQHLEFDAGNAIVQVIANARKQNTAHSRQPPATSLGPYFWLHREQAKDPIEFLPDRIGGGKAVLRPPHCGCRDLFPGRRRRSRFAVVESRVASQLLSQLIPGNNLATLCLRHRRKKRLLLVSRHVEETIVLPGDDGDDGAFSQIPPAKPEA
jgi:hypothetical protein